ncbi:signal transduction histidine kinase [Agromyces terreus]|uniref:histidine kinase n=1 Tax=Agromyces terreus TaxID=424795 RepID=A0A9X2H8I8_9MICO|nr:histidine kinase [Agromyces terreus]MCP2371459.1 signal transduction histidine kinase [Agromyces terreus]
MPVPPWETRSGWDGPPSRGGRPGGPPYADGGLRDTGVGPGGVRFRPSARFRLLAPIVISLLVQVPAAIGIAVWSQAGWAAGIGQVLLAAIGPIALLGIRRRPGPTVALVALAALADLLLAPDAGPPYLALAFAIVISVSRGALVWAASAVVAGWVAAVVLGTAWGQSWHPFRAAFTTLALAACFGIGAFVRTREERMRRYRVEAMARRQSAEERERVRIARELHDVIGHALSQINVQASVGLHLMDRDAEQARTALANIKVTSKTALEEVRSVLGAIRTDADAPLSPQAELAELPRLVAGVASPDLAVRLDDRLDGDAPGRAAQFAAYRIAQEALTNVVRHAAAANAVVIVAREGDVLRVTVDDDGTGPAGASADGSGILGMRERAALLGGSVQVETSPEGGTRVDARLPWTATP